MKQYLLCLGSIVMLVACVVPAAFAGRITTGRLIATLLSEDMGGLADIADNSRFFDHSVSESNIEAIKAVVGKSFLRGLEDEHSFRLDAQRGFTVRSFIEDNRRILEKHPQILAALLRNISSVDNIPVMVEEDGSGVDIAEPARTIPADDLWEYAMGPDGGEGRFRDYLQENYGLENKSARERPDRISAFSVFMNFISGIKSGDIDEDGNDRGDEGLPDPRGGSRGIDYLQDHFVHDAGLEPARNAPGREVPGLFLPSNAALDKIKNLLKLAYDIQLANGPNERAATTDFQGNTLADYMRMNNIGSEPYDVASMSSADIKKTVFSIMAGVVRREIAQDNDYVFDTSSVAQSNGTGTPADNTHVRAGTARPTFVVGNKTQTNKIEEIRKKLITDDLTESERARLELEYFDGGFPLCGPGDDEVNQVKKNYDIILGLPEVVFGGAMNLDSNPGPPQ